MVTIIDTMNSIMMYYVIPIELRKLICKFILVELTNDNIILAIGYKFDIETHNKVWKKKKMFLTYGNSDYWCYSNIYTDYKPDDEYENEFDNIDTTPLHVACVMGFNNIALNLLFRTSNKMIHTNDVDKLFIFACKNKMYDEVIKIIPMITYLEICSNSCPLLSLCNDNKHECVIRLLDHIEINNVIVRKYKFNISTMYYFTSKNSDIVNNKLKMFFSKF